MIVLLSCMSIAHVKHMGEQPLALRQKCPRALEDSESRNTSENRGQRVSEVAVPSEQGGQTSTVNESREVFQPD